MRKRHSASLTRRGAQGYSSTAIALALPADGTLVTCDVNAETMAVAQATWAAAGVTHKARAAPSFPFLCAPG